jgi:hypothetical protein
MRLSPWSTDQTPSTYEILANARSRMQYDTILLNQTKYIDPSTIRVDPGLVMWNE